MNINRVYLCEICLKTYGHEYWDNNGKLREAAECSYVKKAIVYNRECNGEFIDLISKEKYTNFNKYDARVGELFINGKNRMQPLTNIITLMSNKETDDLPKRRVLKIGKEVLKEIDEAEKAKNND